MSFIRRSMRARLEGLRGEAQLLAMAMLVCFAGFLSELPGELERVPDEARSQAVGWLLVGALFFGPLMLMGLAALSRLIARAFGGQGSWQHARLALLWALVLGLPLLLMNFVGLSFLGLIGLAWIWAETLSEAEGFTRSWPAFVLIAGGPVLMMGLSLI